MSKKLLAISSSPRTKGNSDSALDMFLDAVKDKFEIEKVQLKSTPFSRAGDAGSARRTVSVFKRMRLFL